MAPRLLLHIGTEKTGTTAWQAWLARQREPLDQLGYALPSSLGPTNHRKLPTSCFDLDRIDDLVIRSGLSPATPAERQRTYAAWQQDFAAEVRQRPQHTWLVSSEHCSSRLTSPSELVRLQRCLAALFAEITVLLVIREPMQTAISAWSTLVLNGGYPLEDLPPPDHPLLADRCDHRALVQRWQPRFPLLQLHTYQRDVVQLLSRASGLPALPVEADPQQQHNSSLPHQAIVAIARLNRELPVYRGARLNPEREQRIGAIVEAHAGEPGFVPSAEQREQFKAHFAASSDWIQRRFFPERSRLFN